MRKAKRKHSYRPDTVPLPEKLIKRILTVDENHQVLLFQLATRVAFHGRQAAIRSSEMRKYAGSSNDSEKIARFVERSAHILFEVQPDWFCKDDRDQSSPRVFRFNANAWYDLRFPDQRLYKSLPDYKKRRPVDLGSKPIAKVGQPPLFDSSIWTVVKPTPGFLAAIERLQNFEFDLDEIAAEKDRKVSGDSTAYNLLQHLKGKRLFAQYHPTLSGRVQSFGLASMQGLPKVLRPYVTPPEGMEFRYLDFSSEEPRILAYFTHDPQLIADINAKDSIYAVWCEILSMPRKQVKKVVNSLIYGSDGGAEADDRSIARRFWERYPQAKAWKQQQATIVFEQGYSVAQGGLVRNDLRPSAERLKNPTPSGKVNITQARRAGVNHMIQGAAADLTRLIIELLADLVLPIHDGFVILVPQGPEGDARVQEAKAIIDAAVQRIFPGIDLPLVEEPWADADTSDFDDDFTEVDPEQHAAMIAAIDAQTAAWVNEAS